MSEKNKEILEKANAAITEGNNEGFLSVCTDDTEWTFVGDKTLKGKEAVRQWMATTYKEPPKFIVANLIAEGDFVTALGEITMKDENGKAAHYLYCDIWRFRGDKIVELKAFVIPTEQKEIKETQTHTLDYFNLRPKVEKDFGYSHAVKIGKDLKISGAVSMDDAGNVVAAGNMEQQMKNCYSDLEKILNHYEYTFDDVVVENIFTTNMADFIKVSTYRNSIYRKQFPTGTWLEVKGLAIPNLLIEIDMEAHKEK